MHSFCHVGNFFVKNMCLLKILPNGVTRTISVLPVCVMEIVVYYNFYVLCTGFRICNLRQAYLSP